MEIEFKTNEENYLERLSTWLNYEISTSALYVFSYMGGILLLLALIAAIIFTPYMLFVLIVLKKWKWILAFIICVLLPLGVCIYGTLKLDIPYLTIYVPLGFLYFYFFGLKLSASSRLKNIREKRHLLFLQKQSSLNNELWQNTIDQNFSKNRRIKTDLQ